jgi:Protein of unknown function (DUF1203)
MSFRVVPIASAIASEVRKSLRAPQYGHPAHVDTGSDHPPCRLCLRRIRPGEERRILFTYNSFTISDPYPSPGPIFIHEDECSVFEGDSTFPEDLKKLSLTLEGYGAGRWLVAREQPAEDEIEKAIGRIFRNPAARYIHVYSTKAGCFIAHVERIDLNSDTAP